MNITLYFSPEACSRVPLIALEEAGASFNVQLIAFMAGEHRSPDYLRVNPAGKVPALVVDGQCITQNPVILATIAKMFPAARLLPVDTDGAVSLEVLSQLAWFSGDLHPLVTRIRMPQFFCDLPGGPERVRELAMAALALQLAGTEKTLAENKWLCGDDWSLLDGYLFWVWFRVTGAGFSADDFPAIAAHFGRMSNRPSVLRALAHEKRGQEELEQRQLAVKLR